MAMGYSGWYCVLLGALIHVLRLSATKTDTYAKMGNKRFQDAMATSETKSAISCCMTCHRTESCLLVSHNAHTRQCELHGFEIGDDLKILPESGWDVYYNTIRCPSDWSLVGDACYCYYLDMRSRNRSSAQQNCKSLGSELVSIKTATQNNDVIGLIETLYPNIKTNFWLGGYDYSGSNAFVWDDDNTPLSAGFEFWNAREPSNVYDPCMIMLSYDHGYRWNDCPCSVSFPSICKKDARV